MNFCSNLKKFRENKKITQSDLANLLGMAQSTYANYETGNREPDFETLIKLANFFNVSIDYLLGREEPSSGKDTNALDNYNSLHVKIKDCYSNVLTESTEKIKALDVSEQKEVLTLVDAILVRKKYTPGPGGEKESP